MSRKAEYKSAIRSRKMIRHAFVELLLEKDLEKITVKSIVEKAEISRGTFYAHYSDIYAIVEELEDETMGKMIEFLNDYTDVELINNPMPFLLKLVDFFEQDIEFYRKSIQNNCTPPFITKMKNVFIEKIVSYKDNIRPEEEREEFILRVHFLAGGVAAIFQDWFAGEFESTLEELALSISRMMVQGFHAYAIK